MPQPALRKQEVENGFKVGAFLVEPQLLRISKGAVEVRVEPKVMDVVVLLATHQGATVTKDQFMDEVWRGTVVTGDALLRCISELRKVFQDDAREPAYIETIRKKGYRLIAPVVPLAAAAGDGTHASAALPGPPPPAEVFVAPQVDRSALPLRRGQLYAAAVLALFAVLFVGTWRWWPAAREAPYLPLSAVPFTSFAGVEADPHLSPDGTRMAFVWDGGGGFDVYVKQVGADAPLRLTTSAGEEHDPSWSPDGRHVAFVRSSDAGYSVHVVPAVGGAERTVKTFGQREVQSLSWSPDGQQLALSVQHAPYAPFGVSLLPLATGAEHILTRPPDDYPGDVHVAFSPDGRLLAFARSAAEKVDDVFLVPATGGELKRLTFDHAEVTGLDWSRDGRSILYSSDRLGSPALWRVPAAGGAPVWIPTTGEGSGVHQPATARGTGLLAFVQRMQETNIWRYPLGHGPDAGTGGALHIGSTRWDSNPAYAPDGARLAFASNRSGSYEIWISDRDGANVYQLTSFEGPFTTGPRWSPDGQYIAFTAHAGGSVDVYLASAEAGAARRVTTADSNDKAPAWSRDGRWLYFASNRSGAWQVWKKPAAGGEAVQVTSEGGFGAAESPDGRWLYYVKRLAPGLWRMPAGGGPEMLVVPGLQPYDWGNWAVTDDAIYFIRRGPDGAFLAHHDLATGAERTLRPLGTVPKHPALALSPDGREVLVTRIDRVESDILLVNGFE